jgi:hypothetical protein
VHYDIYLGKENPKGVGEMDHQYRWYKNKRGNKIWWLDNSSDTVGEFIFSFDKEKQYNLFADYPNALSPEELAVFKEEEPYWADFFRERE